MKMNDALGRVLHPFFYDYLLEQRNVSRHTVLAYRDALKLFLAYVAGQRQRAVTALRVEDLTATQVLRFLHALEQERHVGIRTRNQRLAALHTFYKYLGAQEPRYLAQCQQVLGIPTKRADGRAVSYLEPPVLQALLAQPDRTKTAGRRDYALWCLMYNTGCRVQELVDVQVADLSLDAPATVRLWGKGRKERLCPLWPQTAAVLRALLQERQIMRTPTAPVFVNQRGQPLTRFGVRYLLKKYARQLADTDPTQAALSLHPHLIRHTTAVHLVQAGVDLNTIRNLLGHVSVNTTTIYVEIDLAMKHAAIEKAQQGSGVTPHVAEPVTDEVLAWLEAL
ncbi:MAG: site-specific integrase [Kiritimatiellia bacterium]|jgi:site-specific recombinase XerD